MGWTICLQQIQACGIIQRSDNQLRMSFLRLYKQLFERAGCILRQNAYFIHTSHFLPSVLIVLDSKQSLIRPLIRQLTRKNDYYLSEQIKKFRLNSLSQQNLHAQTTEITQNGIYGLKFNEETQFLVGEVGSDTLELRKEVKKQDQVYGVVLFKGISTTKIDFMFGHLIQLNFFFLKLFVLVYSFSLFNSIRLKSRYENHSLVKQKK